MRVAEGGHSANPCLSRSGGHKITASTKANFLIFLSLALSIFELIDVDLFDAT